LLWEIVLEMIPKIEIIHVGFAIKSRLKTDAYLLPGEPVLKHMPENIGPNLHLEVAIWRGWRLVYDRDISKIDVIFADDMCERFVCFNNM
jgi:hypothetical protein